MDCLDIASKDGNLAKDVGMPDPVPPGRMFVAPADFLAPAWVPFTWEETLVVFAHGGDVCVAITLVPGLQERPGMYYDPNWLRAMLLTQDGVPVAEPVKLKKPPGYPFGPYD